MSIRRPGRPRLKEYDDKKSYIVGMNSTRMRKLGAMVPAADSFQDFVGNLIDKEYDISPRAGDNRKCAYCNGTSLTLCTEDCASQFFPWQPEVGEGE